jgi:hypothetical protein
MKNLWYFTWIGITFQRNNKPAKERMKGGRKKQRQRHRRRTRLKAIGIIRKIFLNFRRICINGIGLLFQGARGSAVV